MSEQIELQSYPFNSINNDRVYKAEDIQDQRKMYFSTGVFINPSDSLQVISGGGFEIIIREGGANIEGVGVKVGRDIRMELELPDGVLSRIDRVTLRLDRTKRGVYLYVKNGEYAREPKPRPLQRTADAYEIALADIYVKNGVTGISQAQITDLRLDKNLCGITQFNGLDIDYEKFYKQYEQQLKDLIREIERVMGDDVVGGMTQELLGKQDKILIDSSNDPEWKGIKYELEVREGILGLKVVSTDE